MHILFYELAVYESGLKIVKSQENTLMSKAMAALHLKNRVERRYLIGGYKKLVQWTEINIGTYYSFRKWGWKESRKDSEIDTWPLQMHPLHK